ncbi:hypothetical protein Hypma_001089 [Hypsizygus marmoreus]|uniref:Uncharacterized protein n=1 Tax=Hypsizygus marmoreus TaxID=39966 RepID=A0A369J8W8_HYPMA|nr:hypothetical protein Hypma_001089 [Hypsizygus marmoreus]
MTTPAIIRDNAPYHAELMSAIAELDYTPAAKAQQDSYVKDLETQLQRSEEKVKKLAETTQKERKEHASLRDSTARRLAHKLTGRREKFEAMESKEEREYVEALEQELSERDSQNVLKEMLREAKQVQTDLAKKLSKYESLKRDLGNLYDQVFEGPTEDFPEDDRLEYQLHSSQVLHDQIQSTLNAECQAAEILSRADRTMSACEAKMQEALGYSQWDMWGGGGMSDMMERNALSVAQSYANQTEMLCRQAQNASPFVRPIGHLQVAQGSLMSDVFFDNIFTDMAFHRKIQAAAAELTRAHSRLRAERDAANKRANTAGTQLIEAARALEDNRAALTSFRRGTFQAACAQDPSLTQRPPSYDAASTTNRPPPPPPLSPPPSNPSPPSSPSEQPARDSYLPPPESTRPANQPRWGSRNPFAAALAMKTPPSGQDIGSRST